MLAEEGGSPGDLRKSSRSTRPSARLLDVLDSGAAAAEAPGQAAVGRRVRVYWPDEDAWFCGQVTRFDARTGWHSVLYDDGDREQLVLAEERIEWVSTPAGAYPFDRAGCAGTTRRLVRKEETPIGSDPDWPQEGDMLWGRVRGHGWWPARAVAFDEKASTGGLVSVAFFDNTSGWVPRSDCLPFAENFEVLNSRKQGVPSFVAAAKMARLTWRELQSELSEELRRTDATALLEEPAPKRARRAGEEDALFAPLPAFGRAGGGRRLKSKSRRRAKPTSRGSGRAGPLRRYNSSAAASLASASLDVSGLARRLVDLHSRLTPVAAGAQESVASRLRTLRPAPVEVQERKRLLTQLETLAFLPRMRTALAVLEAAHAGCEAQLDLPSEEYPAVDEAPLEVAGDGVDTDLEDDD